MDGNIKKSNVNWKLENERVNNDDDINMDLIFDIC